MKSIIQKDRDRCFLCGRRGTSSDPLDEHHVIFGPFRKIAERYGLKVYLHHFSCHEFGQDSVHQNAEVCRILQAQVQALAMKHYGWTENDFRRIFGKSYLPTNDDKCLFCGEVIPEGRMICPKSEKGG